MFRSYSSDSNYERAPLTRNRDIVRDYYETGEKKSETVYHNERRDGYSREFYKDGTLKVEFFFKNGREHGLAHYYYPSGILKMRLEFKRGHLKEKVTFDSTGAIIGEMSEK